LAIVASGIATVALVWWILLMPTLQEQYVREFGLPRIAEQWGFEFGMVTFCRDDFCDTLPGFVSVKPDGELARLGVRRRDVLFERHGHGSSDLYFALKASERGEVGEFDLFNADDWSAQKGVPTLRTIRVPPQGRGR
jgi:hypothetical protein